MLRKDERAFDVYLGDDRSTNKVVLDFFVSTINSSLVFTQFEHTLVRQFYYIMFATIRTSKHVCTPCNSTGKPDVGFMVRMVSNYCISLFCTHIHG